MSMNPTAGTVTVVNPDNTTSQLAAGSALIDNNWLHHWPATGNPSSVPAFRVMSCVWDEDPGVTDEAVVVAERDAYRAALDLIANGALTWSATQDRVRLRQIAADALTGGDAIATARRSSRANAPHGGRTAERHPGGRV